MSLDKLGVNLDTLSSKNIAFSTYLDIISNKEYDELLNPRFLLQQVYILEKIIKNVIVKNNYYLNLDHNSFVEFTSYFYNTYEDSNSFLLFKDINKNINLNSIQEPQYKKFLYCIFIFDRYDVNLETFKNNFISKRNIEFLNSLNLDITNKKYQIDISNIEHFKNIEKNFFKKIYDFKKLYASFYYMLYMFASYLKIENKLDLLGSSYIDIISKTKTNNKKQLSSSDNTYFLNHINFYDLSYVFKFADTSSNLKKFTISNFNSIGYVNKNKFLIFNKKHKESNLFKNNDKFNFI